MFTLTPLQEAERTSGVNLVIAKAELDLSNYALATAGSVATASSEFSADFPASGAIDADRSHINSGAAGSAENGIGKSTWHGNVLSGGGGALSPEESIEINMGKQRRISRIKIIWFPNATTSPQGGGEDGVQGKAFVIEYNASASGGTWVAWSGLKDRNADIGAPATTISAGVVSSNTADINIFQDDTVASSDPDVRGVLAFRVRIRIQNIQASSKRVKLCEIEITRTIDITTDAESFQVTRRKDYRLNRRLASEITMTLINHDRRFSTEYEPNALEVSKGFFNSELRPNLEVRAWADFRDQAIGLVLLGRFFLDRLDLSAENRKCRIKARDAMKFLIQTKATSKLKSDKRLEDLFELVNNLVNIPSQETVRDSTTIRAALFMPKDENALDQCQKLYEATGDGETFCDFSGRITGKNYKGAIRQLREQTSQADWNGGTGTNIDLTTEPGTIRPTILGTEATFETANFGPLDGNVTWGNLEIDLEVGSDSSIDIFAKSSDDGTTFPEGYIDVLPNRRLIYVQVRKFLKLKFRFRSVSAGTIPKIFAARIRYTARGGSFRYAKVAQLSFKSSGEIIQKVSQVLSDEIGGGSWIVNKALVKSDPLTRAVGSTTVWIMAVGNNPISASNPLFVSVGTLTIEVDLGEQKIDTTGQTLTATFGTAVGTATLTIHPTKPTITLSITGAGTITALSITAFPFEQRGAIQATHIAEKVWQDLYGPREETLENEFITNGDHAQDVAKMLVSRHFQPLGWVPACDVRFSPNLDINDRVFVDEENIGIKKDFGVLSITHSFAASGTHGLSAYTSIELVRIGDDGVECEPGIHSGFKHVEIKLGGCKTLLRI